MAFRSDLGNSRPTLISNWKTWKRIDAAKANQINQLAFSFLDEREDAVFMMLV